MIYLLDKQCGVLKIWKFFFIKNIYSNFLDFIINQDLVIDSAKFYQNMKVNV